MKQVFFLLSFVVLLIASCKEEPIQIPDLSVGARRVLIEEVTGVNCVNCPDAARELANLQNQYGKENLILVGIHAGQDFSKPIPGSQYDFQTNDGYAMTAFVGDLFGVPAAAIARSQKPTDDSPFILSGWAGRIADEFQEDYKIGMFVNNVYDDESRTLDITVSIGPELSYSEELRLTVLITEDSIQDAQLDGLINVPNYLHRHVLREVISKTDGDPLVGGLTAGQLILREYNITLPANWVDHRCSVVAFVHRNGTPDKEVLQVAEAHVE